MPYARISLMLLAGVPVATTSRFGLAQVMDKTPARGLSQEDASAALDIAELEEARPDRHT